jgi:membrane protein
MSIGLLLAAWSGSNIFGTLMGALNTAYDVKETRSWIHQQIVRLATFVVGIVIMVVSTVVFLKGETIAAWIGNSVHLSGPMIIAWKILQIPTALGGLVLLAFITFYALPNVDQHKGRVLFAALLATGLWIVATLLFRVYINHFPPNPAYGIIGAVIILLTWMYYTMFVILAVGELVSELHHGTGAVAPDRGAVFLGRIVNKGGPGGDAAVTRRA